MAGTIICDRIESDASFPSSINIASPIIVSNTFAIPAGSVGAPALSPVGDTNTGIFFPAADQVAVATNGVERVNLGNSATVFNDGGADVDFRVEGDTEANLLFVDASTDRVGIGTTSPGTELDVNGDITADGIYLGGTGSANKLDDYEEGTWTPSFSSSGATFTLNAFRGSYTKIGELVTLSFYVQVTGKSGTLTNSLFIAGLPFASNDNDGASGCFGVYQSTLTPTMFVNNSGDSVITLYRAGTVTTFKANDLSNGYYLGTMTYTAN